MNIIKKTIGYLDGYINRKFNESGGDLKYPAFDFRLKATADIKAGEVINVAVFQQHKEGVTGNVAYSGTIYRETKEENN